MVISLERVEQILKILSVKAADPEMGMVLRGAISPDDYIDFQLSEAHKSLDEYLSKKSECVVMVQKLTEEMQRFVDPVTQIKGMALKVELENSMKFIDEQIELGNKFIRDFETVRQEIKVVQ